MRRDEVIRVLQQHRAEISAYGVNSLALFGSVARDEAGSESDVDVLVEFLRAPRFREFMGLKLFLEQLLGRPVDIADRAGLKPGWKELIEEQSILVA